MEYTHLGRTGLSVTRLCPGTMNFGPLTPPADAQAIMDHAHELGINFFGTSITGALIPDPMCQRSVPGTGSGVSPRRKHAKTTS